MQPYLSCAPASQAAWPAKPPDFRFFNGLLSSCPAAHTWESCLAAPMIVAQPPCGNQHQQLQQHHQQQASWLAFMIWRSETGMSPVCAMDTGRRDSWRPSARVRSSSWLRNECKGKAAVGEPTRCKQKGVVQGRQWRGCYPAAAAMGVETRSARAHLSLVDCARAKEMASLIWGSSANLQTKEAHARYFASQARACEGARQHACEQVQLRIWGSTAAAIKASTSSMRAGKRRSDLMQQRLLKRCKKHPVGTHR